MRGVVRTTAKIESGQASAAAQCLPAPLSLVASACASCAVSFAGAGRRRVALQQAVRVDGQALQDMLVQNAIEERRVQALVEQAAGLDAGNRPTVANAKAFNCAADYMAERCFCVDAALQVF